MPTKVWVAGEEALATDFNAMVQEQVVATFPSAAARNAAIPAPKPGQFSFLTDTGTLHAYFNGAWTLPWSQPWGIVVPVKSSAGLALSTGVQFLPGTASTVIPVPIGRVVRFVVHGSVANVGANGDTQIGVQRDVTPTEYQGQWRNTMGGSAGGSLRATVHVEAVYKTVKANQASSALGVTLAGTSQWEGGTFYVEDLGPTIAGMP